MVTAVENCVESTIPERPASPLRVGMLGPLTVLALHALRERSIPGVATYAVADAACEGVRVSAESQVPRSEVALILCRGFAGTNAALLLRAAR